MTLVKRTVKGTALTHAELDGNFDHVVDRANHSGSQAISSVTGLQTALDGKAASTHSHTAADVTDFAETVRDAMGSALVAGSNITITPNDAGDTITVAATGGGGSGDMAAATYDPGGIAQQVVGITATQTLTNKTLTQPTLTLKQSTNPLPTAEGDIQWDTNNSRIAVGEGSTTKVFFPDSDLTGDISISTGGLVSIAADASGFAFVLDEDDMSSDSATKVPTQQSVKAYVDSVAAGAVHTSASDPTTDDDSANTSTNGVFAAGDWWLNTTSDAMFYCADATATAAVWETVATADDLGDYVAQNAPLNGNLTLPADTLPYGDPAGEIAALSHGASGTYLKSNGAGVAPSWDTPAGSGDVVKVGTPVDNQVGVWTGNGTLEGTSALTFGSGVLTVAGNIIPEADGTRSLGASGTAWADGHFDQITIAGTVIDGTALYTGLQQIVIPASAMVGNTTNGAASGSLETTTNDLMLEYFAFDTGTEEYAQFAVPMPKNWNESTVTLQPIWSHPSTTTNFGVVWGFSAVALSNDDAADTAFGTEVTSTDTGGTTNDIYAGPVTAAMTVAGTPAAEDYVVFRVARKVANGSDTMAVDARLHAVRLLYTVDAANVS